MKKKILFILILVFNLNLSSINAEEVKEFELEGMSVGDSLLEFFSEEQIKNFYPVEYPGSKRIVGWETDESIQFELFSAMTFHVKKDDKNYEILSIKAMLNIDKKEECFKKKKDLIFNIKKNFNFENEYSYEDNYGNSVGDSIAYLTDFDMKDGSSIRVWCSVWDKNHEQSKYWEDDLSLSASSVEFLDFLQKEAYK